jgi:hypothetical protein
MSYRTLASVLFLCGMAIFLSPNYFTPSPEDNGVVWESFEKEMEGYAKVFEDAAKEIKSGEIKTDREFFDAVNPRTGEVRKEARSILDKYFQDRLPRDGVDLKPESASFVENIAKQFLEAASK